MKSFEERIQAVTEARMESEYAETEKLIEIFLDGDDLFVINPDVNAGDVLYASSRGVFVALQPKQSDDG